MNESEDELIRKLKKPMFDEIRESYNIWYEENVRRTNYVPPEEIDIEEYFNKRGWTAKEFVDELRRKVGF